MSRLNQNIPKDRLVIHVLYKCQFQTALLKLVSIIGEVIPRMCRFNVVCVSSIVGFKTYDKVCVTAGPDVTKNFLQRNGLELVVRSHEVKDGGYEVAHDGYLITVFSAPNYCDNMSNKGAYIRFNGNDMVPHFNVFDAVPHPDVKCMAYANQGLFGGLNFS